MAPPSMPPTRALTLLESLVILAVLTVLVVLLYPAFSPAREHGRSQVKNDVTQIATAINAYASEYGQLPTTVRTDVTLSDGEDMSQLMDALCPPIPNRPTALNPRGITFLEIPQATKDGRNGRVNNSGPFRDPWGNPYFILLDGDGDGIVLGPAGSDLRAKVLKRVLVWSRGDPKREGYDRPEKWIKSWE